MWVLDAWRNAEKVTYPVVWEKIKDADNVIDYNINEEITTDKSSVFNANNDTTTGMATVIPWVNAPKLIQTTSIYQNWEWLSGGCTASNSVRLSRPDYNTDSIKYWNISNEYWNIKFENRTDWGFWWNWLIVPTSWWYQIDMTCTHWWSTFSVDVQLRINQWWYWSWTTLIDHPWQYNTSSPVETIKYNFNAWDALYAYLTLNYIWWWGSLSWRFDLSFNITKL